MNELQALGFGPFFQHQLTQWPEVIPARIAAEHRGAYEVWTEAGAGVARLAGRFRRANPEDGLPSVGDWVGLRTLPAGDETVIIDRLFTRRTAFIRGAAGRETKPQLIAANVDLVFVVCGLDGDYNLRRIERYLALVWAGGAQPVLVLNKADLCPDTDARLAGLASFGPGVPIHVTSARHAQGLLSLRDRVGDGLTAAIVGSSGVGKSTLVNALVGEPRMRACAVRAGDDQGCHTTTHRQLVRMPGGGLLLDTPGMRELQVVDDGGLEATFGDLASYASQCRFRDCSHTSEPGCAVRQAVASGELPSDRLESLHDLEGEARSYERRHNARLRRQAERVTGQRSDEAARLRRWKWGL